MNSGTPVVTTQSSGFTPAPGRDRRRRARRCGTTLVEAALTLPILLVLVLGTLDLGLAVFRSHLLSFAARVGTREVMVHGEYADRLGVWGPAAVDQTLESSTHPLAVRLRPHMVGMDPADVRLQIEWLDGHNRLEGRVRVRLSTTYQPLLTVVFRAGSFPLEASSTVPIAH